MIIGETFKSDYDGYEEENYDYLFKRKSKEERQQRKADNKQKRAVKKQGKQAEKANKGATKKHHILGNFGLFNKNKKKEAAEANEGGSSGSSGKKESDDASGSSSGSDGKQGGAGLEALAAGAAGLLDKSKGGNDPAGEGNEGAKSENKELDANGNPKKQAGMGALFGFACLGIVILIAGVAIYKADKKPISELQPLRAAA